MHLYWNGTALHRDCATPQLVLIATLPHKFRTSRLLLLASSVCTGDSLADLVFDPCTALFIQSCCVDHADEGHGCVVSVSAMGGPTNETCCLHLHHSREDRKTSMGTNFRVSHCAVSHRSSCSHSARTCFEKVFEKCRDFCNSLK